MNFDQASPLKIGIIGAGFSGTALSAAFHRLSSRPIEIILFEKSGQFGTGDAYRTPFPFHLLNVRAKDMSAFEDEPRHFVDWLNAHESAYAHLDQTEAFAEQFAPRFLFRNYLQDLLKQIQSDARKIKLQLEPSEVCDINLAENKAVLVLKDGREITVDKVVLAVGNNPPTALPFPVSDDLHCISNPWNYTAPQQIPAADPVLIVGTGLSMIDTVLTLYHQQHQGPIYAISRRGLLPLPHTDRHIPFAITQAALPEKLRPLTKHLRKQSESHVNEGGNWRDVINALRAYVPAVWAATTLSDKKRFLRHLMPYWNIHRHRVHEKIANLLAQLSAKQQLKILGARIIAVEDGSANIKLRYSNHFSKINVKWLINCLGPSLTTQAKQQPLLHSLLERGIATLDALNLGLNHAPSGALQDCSGKISSIFYTLGPLRKGVCWESGAVPEIRKQCFDLAKHLLV